MNLFFFNYSHDLALANGCPNYILPRHVAMLERDLMPLAAFCAKKGDAVVVDKHLTAACRDFYGRMCRGVSFADLSNLHEIKGNLRPWGIDRRLQRVLTKSGFSCDFGSDDVENLYLLSSRLLASGVLALLHKQLPELPLCGRSVACHTEAELRQAVAAHPFTILKAPWSGSGRGLRFASSSIEPPLSGWCRNILQAQGTVMVEPLYNKVTDLAAEFFVEPAGAVRYVGLSVFHTTERCTYLGNVIAPQSVLEQTAFEKIGIRVFREVVNSLGRLLEAAIRKRYTGSLGVDMMICRDKEGLKLHPCVEINMRNTMGILSLSLERLVSRKSTGMLQMRYEHTEQALQGYAASLEPPCLDEEGRLLHGSMPLIPILPNTRYLAWASATPYNWTRPV